MSKTMDLDAAAEFASRIEQTVASRQEAVKSGRVERRGAGGTWSYVDKVEVIGRDGIDMSTGQAALYSHREVPWHLLGTVADEALDAEHALDAGGLLWTVETRPIFAGATTESVMGTDRINDRWATVRTDTGAALGVVGRRYVPFQNSDAFAFLTDIVGMGYGEVTFETAGAVQGGRKVFVTMYLPLDVVLDAEGAADRSTLYLVAVNSHDGQGGILTMLTFVRIVCINTLNWATQGAVRKWSIRHTKSAKDRVAEARQALGLSLAYRDRFAAEAEAMLATPMTNQQFDRFVASNVWKLGKDATDRTKSNVAAKRDEARRLFREAKTTENIRGTVWGAEQALTEQIDWFNQVRVPKGLGLNQGIVRATKVVEDDNEKSKTAIHRKLLTLTNK